MSRTPHTPAHDARTSDWRWSVGLAVYLVAVAWWALPREIQAGDAGEFSTIMLAGGSPHASG